MNEDEVKAAHALAIFETEELLAELDRLVQVYEAEAEWERSLSNERFSSEGLGRRRTSVANYHLGQFHACRAAAFALRRTLGGIGRELGDVPGSRHPIRKELETAANQNGWLVETLPGGAHWDVNRTDMFRRGRHTLEVSYGYVSGEGYLGDVRSAYYDGDPVDAQDRASMVLGLLRRVTREPVGA